DFARGGSEFASRRLFVSGQPVRSGKGGGAAIGVVLVSGAWPRRGQRVVGQVLSGLGFDSHESQRRRTGAADDSDAEQRVSRCRAGAHDETWVAVPAAARQLHTAVVAIAPFIDCHPERSEGSAFCRELQIPYFVRDDNSNRWLSRGAPPSVTSA